MKKIFSLFFALLVVLLNLYGCSSTSEQKQINSPIVSNTSVSLVDKTVNVPISTDMKGKSIMSVGTAADRVYLTNGSIPSLTDISQNIIRAKTKKVTYTSVKGIAFIKVDVQVVEVLKGSLKPNDLISYFELGGYVPLKETIKEFGWQDRFKNLSNIQIENTIEKYVIDGEPFPTVNEESLLFLNPAHGTLPSNAFERADSYSAEFKFVNDQDTLKRCQPAAESSAINSVSIKECKTTSDFKTYSYNQIKKSILSNLK